LRQRPKKGQSLLNQDLRSGLKEAHNKYIFAKLPRKHKASQVLLDDLAKKMLKF